MTAENRDYEIKYSRDPTSLVSVPNPPKLDGKVRAGFLRGMTGLLF